MGTPTRLHCALSALAPSRARRRRARRGMTLVEVVVAIAILVGLIAVVAPVFGNILALEQRRAARELALSYELMHDEAVLKNATFRVAYHLDGNWYQIEVGDTETLVFRDPEERKRFEEERASRLKRYSKEDAAAEQAKEPQFSAIAARFQARVDLPSGTAFGGVYTPQYGELVRPKGEVEDPEDPLVVYSYLFSDGFAEHTLVQLVSTSDPNEGFTVEIDPLSGKVTLHTELLDPRDLRSDVPDQGPELPL